MKLYLQKIITGFIVTFISLFFRCGSANAYIGPGAGIAFVSSLFGFLIVIILVIFILILLPFRALLKALKRKSIKGKYKKVIVIGFDGLDPVLVRKLLNKNKLPHFKRIIEQGCFNGNKSSLAISNHKDVSENT